MQPLLEPAKPVLRIAFEGGFGPLQSFSRGCLQQLSKKRSCQVKKPVIPERLGFAPEGFQRDRSLPPPVAGAGGRSVGIAKEQLAATIAIPGPIGKPFGGAEVAEPQAQKNQLFLVKLLYGMFGISLTAPSLTCAYHPFLSELTIR